MLTLLFPCLPYSLHTTEPIFEPQRRAAEAAGLPTALLSYEDLQQEERVMIRPAVPAETLLLLRGWMLKSHEYARLADRLLISKGEYELCHFLPNWYSLLCDLTAETVFPTSQSDIEALLQDWGRAFVKDAVKSYSAEGLPIVSSLDELQRLTEQMLLYREEIEGGLCFRRVESLHNEHRLFVWRGQVHARHAPPTAVALGQMVAERIPSPFFSVDVAERSDGVWRVVELGDGQVSDLKEWDPESLMAVLSKS